MCSSSAFCLCAAVLTKCKHSVDPTVPILAVHTALRHGWSHLFRMFRTTHYLCLHRTYILIYFMYSRVDGMIDILLVRHAQHKNGYDVSSIIIISVIFFSNK